MEKIGYPIVWVESNVTIDYQAIHIMFSEIDRKVFKTWLEAFEYYNERYGEL